MPLPIACILRQTRHPQHRQLKTSVAITAAIPTYRPIVLQTALAIIAASD